MLRTKWVWTRNRNGGEVKRSHDGHVTLCYRGSMGDTHSTWHIGRVHDEVVYVGPPLKLLTHTDLDWPVCE